MPAFSLPRGVSEIPEQIAHVKNLMNVLLKNNSVIDTSPTGRGKTYVAATICRFWKMRPVVICPPGVVKTWEKVLRLYEVEPLEIISYHSLAGTKSRDSASHFLKRQNLENGEHIFEVTEEYAQLVENERVMLIFDEAQTMKNMSTYYEAALALSWTITNTANAETKVSKKKSRVLIISASPGDSEKHVLPLLTLSGIVRSLDLYNYDRSNKETVKTGFLHLENWCRERDVELTDDIVFSRTFTTKTAVGLAFDLFRHIVAPYLIRAMDPLPFVAKTQNGFYLIDDDEEAILADAIRQLGRAIEAIKDGIHSSEGLGNVIVAMKGIETAKIGIFIRLARSILRKNPNAKVVIFVNFLETLKTIEAALSEFNPLVANGSVPPQKRSRLVDQFNEANNNNRVFLGTTACCKEGISLHDTHGGFPRTHFISPTFKFIEIYQSLGRCARQGTLSEVFISLVYGNSATNDELMKQELNYFQKLADKSEIARNFIRGADDPDNIVDIPRTPGEFPEYIETFEAMLETMLYI